MEIDRTESDRVLVEAVMDDGRCVWLMENGFALRETDAGHNQFITESDIKPGELLALLYEVAWRCEQSNRAGPPRKPRHEAAGLLLGKLERIRRNEDDSLED